MIDNLVAMKVATDREFATLLGIEFHWTEFVIDVLLKRGLRTNGAMFEDMVTDIIRDIILALQHGNLKEKIDWIRATSCDDVALMNKLKPVMTAAIDLRWRDFRRRKAAQIGVAQIPEKFEAGFVSDPGAELNAVVLRSMIEDELKQRAETKCRKLALRILPDRFDGLSLRDICDKHQIPRGGSISSALKEIYNVVTTVAERLQEGWMFRVINVP